MNRIIEDFLLGKRYQDDLSFLENAFIAKIFFLIRLLIIAIVNNFQKCIVIVHQNWSTPMTKLRRNFDLHRTKITDLGRLSNSPLILSNDWQTIKLSIKNKLRRVVLVISFATIVSEMVKTNINYMYSKYFIFIYIYIYIYIFYHRKFFRVKKTFMLSLS